MLRHNITLICQVHRNMSNDFVRPSGFIKLDCNYLTITHFVNKPGITYVIN